MREDMSSFNDVLEKVDDMLQVERSYRSKLGSVLPLPSTCAPVCRGRALSDRKCVRIKIVEEGGNSRSMGLYFSKIRNRRRERRPRDRRMARTLLSRLSCRRIFEKCNHADRWFTPSSTIWSFTQFLIGHRTARADGSESRRGVQNGSKPGFVRSFHL